MSHWISWWPYFSTVLNWETFRSCMPFYPPLPNNPLVLLPSIHVPIMSLWVAPGFHEDSLALPQLCVPRTHLYMCWHAAWSVQTWWLAKQKWLVIAPAMSVFMEILASFLCPTDFLKPYVRISLQDYPSTRYDTGWMICSNAGCVGWDADELRMCWHIDTTHHKSSTKDLFSY